MSVRTALLEFLRVPPAPSAPAGDEGVRVFRAAPNFFRYRLAQWILGHIGTLGGLVFGVIMLRQAHRVIPPEVTTGPITWSESTILAILTAVEIFAIAGVAFQAVFSLALLRLDFEQRWYLVSDRSLRIREGLVRLNEKTMTFANIQQLGIRQGPIQRLLGIADIEVRTAGGGGGGHDESGQPRDDLHVGYFRGVADAEKIRDTIRERLRRHRDAGLGDPDDAPEIVQREHLPVDQLPSARRTLAAGAEDAAAASLAAAASELRREAAALRIALQR
jgi:uncharacterized membrane protein YdbT with pleckstrin-like domain